MGGCSGMRGGGQTWWSMGSRRVRAGARVAAQVVCARAAAEKEEAEEEEEEERQRELRLRREPNDQP